MDFVKAMQSLIPTHEMGDGRKWRWKWRQVRLREFVVGVFEMLVEDLARGVQHKTPGAKAEFYWSDFGGAAAEKNLRNLLVKH